jgi:hypothetical protein
MRETDVGPGVETGAQTSGILILTVSTAYDRSNRQAIERPRRVGLREALHSGVSASARMPTLHASQPAVDGLTRMIEESESIDVAKNIENQGRKPHRVCSQISTPVPWLCASSLCGTAEF